MSDEEKFLQLRRAVESHFPNYAYDLDKILKDPEFDKAGYVNDWRAYVPDEVRTIWGELNTSARLSIILITDEVAHDEHWE